MTDEQTRIEARKWRGPILRGDCTVEYAAIHCVGKIIYPYADNARYAHVYRIVADTLARY